MDFLKDSEGNDFGFFDVLRPKDAVNKIGDLRCIDIVGDTATFAYWHGFAAKLFENEEDLQYNQVSLSKSNLVVLPRPKTREEIIAQYESFYL